MNFYVLKLTFCIFWEKQGQCRCAMNLKLCISVGDMYYFRMVIYRSASFQETSWFQEVLPEISWFLERLRFIFFLLGFFEPFRKFWSKLACISAFNNTVQIAFIIATAKVITIYLILRSDIWICWVTEFCAQFIFSKLITWGLNLQNVEYFKSKNVSLKTINVWICNR